MSSAVQGTVAEGFEGVRDEFAAALAEERAANGADNAAQLVVHTGGERVVDLWTGPGLDADSLTPVYSITKAATYLTVALLVQDGTLDLDQRVAHYWPEFTGEGKERLTLRELLTHRAGLIGVDGGFTPDELADDRKVAERLAGQRPFWRPGAAFGYHAVVIGALAGEVVRRATGKSVQEIYEERIRAPYGLDLYLGLPAELEPRVVSAQQMVPTAEQKAGLTAAAPSPHSLLGISFAANNPATADMTSLANTRQVHALGPASWGGLGSARGIAKLFAAAVAEVDGRPPLLKPDTAAEFAQIHATGHDVVVRQHVSWGIGFKAIGDFHPGVGALSFGHEGAGGQLGFADPQSGFAYGYNRRRFAFPGGEAPENARLIKAVVKAVRNA
ncbi:serine hydrolase domain-containing protein [Streptomyces boninensis]|uniref:serine hydrolase domain-containing protein n=1 Tax=Streptomyces boninensis TaxID=2039455 RepID=UPI003B20E8A7